MNPRVLIADDSLTVRMDLAEAFEQAGWTPLTCATIAAAREALAAGPVALAVLDVLLPDGDGIELLRELRESATTASLPVLILSSEAQVKDRVRGLRTGANDYVGKPYDRDAVVARARELLRATAGAVLEPAQRARPAVLVIDDSATFRAELTRELERAGYAVLSAANGHDGLRVASAQQPAAIIVDGLMPGIDGATVIRRLRIDAALRATPCLLLTASEDPAAEVGALDSGADAFVRKGEELDVILARLAAVLRSSSARVAAAVGMVGTRRILAVDDSTTYLHQLGETLRGEGYDVIEARSGEEAIEVLTVQGVDCILLDLVMPGLGGQETCRRIKAAPGLREVPLILITAREEPNSMLEGFGAGADDYVAKSGEFEVLHARIRAQLRRKQLEEEHRRVQHELRRAELDANEVRSARRLAQTKAALADELAEKNERLSLLAAELERKNRELEAFSYSVSHDLRAPLRAINGFAHELREDHLKGASGGAEHCLERILAAAVRMESLIEDLLQLSRVSLSTLVRGPVSLSNMAQEIAEELARREPERRVECRIQPELEAQADAKLVRVMLENLLGNAWKFTGRSAEPRVELRAEQRGSETLYCVCDNGAGFEMAYARKLFHPFERLHSEQEFPGTGIGLATVQRIAERHGGRVWAEGAVNQGASFFFTLPAPPASAGTEDGPLRSYRMYR